MDFSRMRLSSLFPVNQNQGGTAMNGDLIPLERNRLSQLFDVNQAPPISNESPIDVGHNQPSFSDDVMYEPEHSGIDRMNSMLTSMPERNHPGMMRKIFGGIAQGLGGGPEAYENIAYAPYHREMADWQAKYKPISELADAERNINTSNRQFATSVMGQRNTERRLAETERNNLAKNENDRKKTEISQQNAATQRFKAEHPNAHITTNKAGQLIAVDRTTGEAHKVLDESGAPVLSGNLSNDMKAQLQLTNALTRIEAEEDSFEQREAVRQKNRESLANLTHDNRLTEITKRADVRTDDDSDNPNKVKVDQYNRAQKAFNSHPEWQKWINLQDPGTNTFTLKTPDDLAPSNFFGMRDTSSQQQQNINEYADILGEIYGPERKATYLNSQKSKTPTNTPAKNTDVKVMPPVEKRTKGMKWTFPNGNIGQWDGTKWVIITLAKGGK